MGIGTLLAQSLQTATGITPGAVVEDWKHASNVFVANNMLRSPKFKGLFHVNFVFNNWTAPKPDPKKLSAAPLNSIKEQESFNDVMRVTNKSDVLSVLTKSISLPKFDIQYSTHNQYNKTTHTYKKIKYDPVTVTFHDDMADYIWGLWAFYYCWYFADGTKGYSGDPNFAANKLKVTGQAAFQQLLQNAVSNIFNKVAQDTTQGTSQTPPANIGSEWDYSMLNPTLIQPNGLLPSYWTDSWGMNGSIFQAKSFAPGAAQTSVHLLKAIEIYPLGNKKASMIVLQNPRIVGWDHDEFDYSAQGTATCKMTLAYEGVTYCDQVPAANILQANNYYDRHPSPLTTGSPTGLLGENGILGRVGGIIGNITSGNFGIGDIVSAVSVARAASKLTGSGVSAELSSAVHNSVVGVGTNSALNKKFPAPAPTMFPTGG